MSKIKLSRKHISIFETIEEQGKYKPTYSDQEPALKTLIRLGLVKWKGDFSGVIFTELGNERKTEVLNLNHN